MSKHTAVHKMMADIATRIVDQMGDVEFVGGLDQFAGHDVDDAYSAIAAFMLHAPCYGPGHMERVDGAAVMMDENGSPIGVLTASEGRFRMEPAQSYFARHPEKLKLAVQERLAQLVKRARGAE